MCAMQVSRALFRQAQGRRNGTHEANREDTFNAAVASTRRAPEKVLVAAA